MVFHWSLSDCKCLQVSRTLLSILADLNNAVLWMVSTRPLISKSSSPFNNHLVIVPRSPITISIIVTFLFHSFFNSLTRSRNLSFFSLSFNFSVDRKVHNSVSSLFDRLAKIGWSVCMSKSQRSLCVSFYRTDVGLCIYVYVIPGMKWFLHRY